MIKNDIKIDDSPKNYYQKIIKKKLKIKPVVAI
jgi:hypothetical protein